AVARELTDDRRDVAASAPASDEQRPGEAAQFACVRMDPAQCCVAILSGCRETMFRCVSIANAEEDHASTSAQVTTERLVGFLITQHPAAAVEVDDDRVRARRRRPIQ